MNEQTVGISDMSLYVPELRMGLDTILERRAAEDPPFERRLRRAIESTNQLAIRFPANWQDAVTLAAQASRDLLARHDNLEGIRFFGVGTETSVDMSKPISAYAQGALQRSGVAIPRSLSTFQVQHACAGGTIAMMSVGAMLQAAGRAGESGLVVCSDIARYASPSTAEITQGAGAVAMRIETNPQLVELDLGTAGLASSDEDDFFRPLGSITARVKGRYSVDCYNDALDSAFVDHASRRGMTPRDVLESTDLFVVHVPFHRMAVTGMIRLVEHHLDADPAAAREFLEARHFDDGIEATRHIGNIYSGSAYMSLMFALRNRYKAIGDNIVGKNILIASYGSGNTMTVLSARVAAGAPRVLASWNLQAVLDAGQDADFETYLSFVERETYSLDSGPISDGVGVAPGSYYLSGIRDDGYRQYEFAPT